MNQYTTQIKRERVQSQWIKRKQQDVFQGLSTELYVPAFTEKDFQSTRSTELLSQPIQPPPRQSNGLPKTGVPNSTNTTKSTLPRGIQAQSTSTEEGYKYQPTPPHQEGVNHNLNLYQRGSNQQPKSKSTSTKEGQPQRKGLQLGGYKDHKLSLFPQTNDPKQIGQEIQLKCGKSRVWKIKTQRKTLGKTL